MRPRRYNRDEMLEIHNYEGVFSIEDDPTTGEHNRLRILATARNRVFNLDLSHSSLTAPLALIKMFVEQMFEDMPRCDELNAAKKVVQDLTGQNSKSRRTGRPQCLTSSSTFRPLGPALRHWRRLSSSCRES
ncbi:hypothetical protein EUTSA_v10000615mg [Eutrema salsugineum]|uniref:Uncharacterized protein n=1 Tax=Eutrema salsugineum TaxID=72664 RepID=V4LRN5_EUTSA|nr:hypothetical protein EUTSA_v10000615mg [Eutrema salsugineum]